MCGIFGYIGDRDPLETSIAALEQLEYRGYDSTGIAGIQEGALTVWKKAGKLSNLKKVLKPTPLTLAIGHTRWATHGKVSDENAHPHFDSSRSIALVHNGIIENYDALRKNLQASGVVFVSETDTEVIAQLIASHYKGDLLAAVQTALPHLHGIYAIALIHKNHPGQIIAAARSAPLAVGFDDARTEAIIASDPNAFFGAPLNVLFLQNGEIASVKKGRIDIIHPTQGQIERKSERLHAAARPPSKEGFEHFMRKEIGEQSATIQKAMLGRVNHSLGDCTFDELNIADAELKRFTRALFLGCGTSANAGAIGAAYLEQWAKIPASCDIASEARYRMELLTPDTLVIAMSQSGETADTLAAMREAKQRGCKVLSLCNVKNSTIVREADGTIDLKAGPEMSVCSTKAFTSQLATLALFAIHMARLRHLSAEEGRSILDELAKIPAQVQQVIDQEPKLMLLAQKYAHYDNFFFLGRRVMFTTALEAALKLKEISYVNANGYPAGELKHGPIALLDTEFPVIAFCANRSTEEKIASSLMEVKARGAPILAFASEGMQSVADIANDVFWLPACIDLLAPFVSSVAGQLFAYHIAKIRGCDIDQPRNLAKSVTVE